MANLADIARLVPGENGLASVNLVAANGTVHSSVVNAGVMPHPVGEEQVVAFVVRGDSYKLRRLRNEPAVTVTFRVGWDWAAVQGTVDIIGPNDPFDGFDQASLPHLLRDVFAAAGGDHDDWDEYDRVMAEEERTALLVKPNRFLGRR